MSDVSAFLFTFIAGAMIGAWVCGKAIISKVANAPITDRERVFVRKVLGIKQS